MTKIIGLTGGIGSGKTTVARLLKELGAVVIDADSLAHAALSPGSETWREVVAAFGQEIVSSGSEIDRAALAKVVFNDPELLAWLNRIMHPRLRDTAIARLEEYRRQGAAVVVIEAPLLIEAGWDAMVDEVWVVTASESRILERLEKERGLKHTDILARMRSQLSSEERLKHANVIINNDSGLDELRDQVAGLWRRFLSDAKRG
ncbi:MAG: dephospho-CoA kinase [Chloroflexi bacterium]|nr:dephospho-CoA kinase [Chloroflexota bacterium]